MSEDREFDEFLARARASHLPESAPPSAAQRLEEAVGARVQWRRQVSPKLATALAVMMSTRTSAGSGETPNRQHRLAGQWSWTKLFVVALPALGLAVMSYSVASVSSAPVSAPSKLAISVASNSAPSSVAVDSRDVGPGSNAVAPGDLPDAKDLPSVHGPSESAAQAKAPSANHASRTNQANQANQASDGRFEAELALLTRITTARREKHAARALALIEEHDRRFPSGALTPECAGERVLALAALGRDAEACTHAKAFLAKYPTSPFVPEVRSACADSIHTR